MGTKKVRIDLIEQKKRTRYIFGSNVVKHKILACVIAALVTLVRIRVEVLLLVLFLRPF